MGRQVVLAGFHAVSARIRTRPDSVSVIYVDEGRRDRRMRDFLALARERGLRLTPCAGQRLDGLSPRLPHQGVVALAAPSEASMSLDQLLDSVSADTLLLVLDGVTDPHNLGACLRVADAAGARAVITPRDRSASLDSPIVARASAGASETVPLVTVTNLAAALTELSQAGVWTVGTAADAVADIYSVDQRRALAWVLGAEGQGLRQLTRRRCDQLASVPMAGAVESLNVSVACGVCLFETVRQRRQAPASSAGS